MKKCSKCKIIKPDNEFYVDRKRNHPTSWCKACSQQASKKYYANNSDKARLAHRLWVVKNQDTVKFHKAKSAYGITKEEYLALVSVSVCTICGTPENLCIDHSHQSGRVRGKLCVSCNKGLGFFKDNPTLLLRASDYLTGIAQPDIFEATYEAVS